MLPHALKNCPICNKSPNLVSLGPSTCPPRSCLSISILSPLSLFIFRYTKQETFLTFLSLTGVFLCLFVYVYKLYSIKSLKIYLKDKLNLIARNTLLNTL